MKINNNPRQIFDCRKEKIDYTMDQKKALLMVDTFLQSKESFLLIAGNAGTGKTTIAENIANYCKADVLAPTNAAIKRLRDKVTLDNLRRNRFFTIHQKLYGSPDPVTGEFELAGGLNGADVYIVDEASMIDETVLGDLTREALRSSSKIIFLGDDFQLEPVGKDPKLFEWEKTPMNQFNKNYRFKLNQVMRNEGTILEIATHLRSCKDDIEILNRDTQDFKITPIFSNELFLDIRDGNNFIILVSTNKTRVRYNQKVRQTRFEEESVNVVNNGENIISVGNNQYLNGEHYIIKHPKILKTYDRLINIGSKMYPKKKRLTFYLIEHEVKGNSDSFKTLLFPELDIPSLHGNQLMNDREIYTDRDLTRNIGTRRAWDKRVNIATYGYATSVHKSQGNEWDNVYIDCDWLSEKWNKPRWMYTAITRARKKVELKISNQFKVID